MVDFKEDSLVKIKESEDKSPPKKKTLIEQIKGGISTIKFIWQMILPFIPDKERGFIDKAMKIVLPIMIISAIIGIGTIVHWIIILIRLI